MIRWAAESGSPSPQTGVLAILQTRAGYLWLGTNEGLVRYDGTRFETFDEKSEPGLRSRRIRALCEDAEGTLWIGTAGGGWIASAPGGLLRFTNGRFETLDSARGLPNDSVRALAEDREGSLWVGTNGGLARLGDLKFVNYTTRNGLGDDLVRVVCEADDGALWLTSAAEEARRGCEALSHT